MAFSVFLGVALFELPGLIRKGQYREVAAFGVLWVVGFGISVWLSLGKPFPYVTYQLGKAIKQLIR